MANQELKAICESAATHWPKRKRFKVNFSHENYRKLKAWQWKDRYPALLSWREKGSYYLARVK